LLLANALRDYEALSQESVPDFLPRPTLFSVLKSSLLGQRDTIKWQSENRRREKLLSEIPVEMRKYMFRELNREIRLDREKQNAFLERLWMGIFGGIALIGPMLLMVLHRDRNTSIITTSVATVIFAILLALAARGLGGKDVLAATAAYAAVLVVFVGASLAPIT